MPRNWPGLCRWALVGGVAVLTSGCSGSSGPSASALTHPTYRYGCCAAGDLDHALHAGDTFAVHWIVTDAPPTDHPTPVRLGALLNGPFTSVSLLKARPTAAPAVSSVAVRTTDWAGGSPVSVFDIPAAAAPGFYNLTTTVSVDGQMISAGAIVQVVSATP